jgi:hypothetical protein
MIIVLVAMLKRMPYSILQEISTKEQCCMSPMSLAFIAGSSLVLLG